MMQRRPVVLSIEEIAAVSVRLGGLDAYEYAPLAVFGPVQLDNIAVISYDND